MVFFSKLGCKRITPSDKYLETFNNSHVKLVTDKIDRFTSNGIITKSQSGEEIHVECDVIILGTGFSVFDSVTKSVTFIGKSGEKLQNEWRNSQQPKAYLGKLEFRNKFMLLEIINFEYKYKYHTKNFRHHRAKYSKCFCMPWTKYRIRA